VSAVLALYKRMPEFPGLESDYVCTGWIAEKYSINKRQTEIYTPGVRRRKMRSSGYLPFFPFDPFLRYSSKEGFYSSF
jgi:hypothetical protein